MLQRAVRFSLADLVTSAAAGLLLVAGTAAGVPRTAPGPFALVAAAFLLPFAFAAVRGRRPRPGSLPAHVAEFGPILPLLLVFDNLGPFVVATSSVDRDPFLVAADRLLFLGSDPTRLLEPFTGPLLLEVLTVCYALYYFHPIVLGALLWRDDHVEKTPGKRLVLHIVGDDIPAKLERTIEFTNAEGIAGTVIRITDRGEVPNVFLRLARIALHSPARPIEDLLDDLAEKYGVPSEH